MIKTIKNSKLKLYLKIIFFGLFETFILISYVTFASFFKSFAVLNANSNQEVTERQFFINLDQVLDEIHTAINYLGVLLFILVLIRTFFPSFTKKLGDYLLLQGWIILLVHALSQIFLETCVITSIRYFFAQSYNIAGNYEFYRWNPLNLPEFLVLPFYFLEAAISIWGIYRMYFILKEKE